MPQAHLALYVVPEAGQSGATAVAGETPAPRLAEPRATVRRSHDGDGNVAATRVDQGPISPIGVPAGSVKYPKVPKPGADIGSAMRLPPAASIS
jgi:hypothetical protein